MLRSCSEIHIGERIDVALRVAGVNMNSYKIVHKERVHMWGFAHAITRRSVKAELVHQR